MCRNFLLLHCFLKIPCRNFLLPVQFWKIRFYHKICLEYEKTFFMKVLDLETYYNFEFYNFLSSLPPRIFNFLQLCSFKFSQIRPLRASKSCSQKAAQFYPKTSNFILGQVLRKISRTLPQTVTTVSLR